MEECLLESSRYSLIHFRTAFALIHFIRHLFHSFLCLRCVHRTQGFKSSRPARMDATIEATTARNVNETTIVPTAIVPSFVKRHQTSCTKRNRYTFRRGSIGTYGCHKDQLHMYREFPDAVSKGLWRSFMAHITTALAFC